VGKNLATEIPTLSPVVRNCHSTLPLQSCLNLESTSTERLQMIKSFNQLHGLSCANPKAETQTYEKKKTKQNKAT
jgi:hypothetical protein